MARVNCNVCNLAWVETTQADVEYCCMDCQNDIKENGPADAIINDNLDLFYVQKFFDGEKEIIIGG
jgi:hypothetical protein